MIELSWLQLRLWELCDRAVVACIVRVMMQTPQTFVFGGFLIRTKMLGVKHAVLLELFCAPHCEKPLWSITAGETDEVSEQVHPH